MGRKGTGGEIRGKAIRMQFSLNGEVIRRTLKRDGRAIPPSSENLAEGAGGDSAADLGRESLGFSEVL